MLKQCIGETIGEAVKIVDPAKNTAESIKEILENRDMLNDGSEKPINVFYVSDITDKFEKICIKTLKRTYTPAKIDIEKY